MKLLHGPDQEAIIELFKKAENGKFYCEQCKREGDLKFNSLFLVYDTYRIMCSDCEGKIEKAYQEQKLTDKLNAFELFKKKHEEIIDDIITHTGVPVIFKKACMNDLGHTTAQSLSTEQSYFIKGGVGVGKSHMAVALMRAYIKAHKPEYNESRKEYYLDDLQVNAPIFVEVPELLLRIRDTYSKDSNESEKDIVEFYTRTPYLVLDDLGSEKASEFSTLMLYLMINRRCTQNKTTIITSNLSLEQIEERLSDRVSSRIKGMCRVINVSGNDKRYESKYGHGVSLAKQ